jgi:asparagine synthase (glutamine-hydrolysing)
MLLAAPHRGSDLTVKIHGACALGVSVGGETIDSAISAEGSVMAAFTGRLDNACDLLATVTAAGFVPASHNPADIVVSAFQAFGPQVPDRMRGAFAVAVTNGHELWCFRDHIGLRSGFYRDDPKGLFFASEAKQVLAGTGIVREPDLEMLESILYGRMTKETPSALKGIERLPKMTVLHATGSNVVKLPPYWSPTKLFETARFSTDEVGEAFSEVFQKVIRRSLTGKDVIAMSGGIDSPAVAAYAAPLHRELKGGPLSALSHVYPDYPKVDERRYIELIADFLQMKLHTCTPTAGPWDDVAHWCTIFDGPVHTLSLPEVTEFYSKARQLGFRNVFTGDVAEIVFDRSEHIFSHLLTRGRWKALGTLMSTMRKQGVTRRALARSLTTTFVPGRFANWYLHSRGLDYPVRIPDWMDARKVNEVSFRRDLLQPGRDRWAYLQLGPFLEGAAFTLEADDVCGLLCGVTIRRPFADIDVCEFFLSLPAELKFPDKKSKTLMRRMLRGRLPDQILDRRDKTVFNDYLMSKIDYASLRKYLLNPTVRLPGVNYERLAARIERQDFKIADYAWANDLIRIHAFLNLW